MPPHAGLASPGRPVRFSAVRTTCCRCRSRTSTSISRWPTRSSATTGSISGRWTSSGRSTGSTPDRDLAAAAAGLAKRPRATGTSSGWRYLALPQQVTGGTVICIGIAEGIRDDQGARDGRQHFGRMAWREPFLNELVQAHLEKALHFRRNGGWQILRAGAEYGARAHAPFGQSRAAEGV